MNLEWNIKKFDELSLMELYQIIRARIEVFVLEQNCPYQDLDNLDYNSWHLFAVDKLRKSEHTEIVAYLRIVKPKLKYNEASIGRVITTSSYRKKGLGRKLMRKGIQFTEELYGNGGIRISAQKYLEHFYQSLGFISVSDVYLEDGIKHIEMLRN